MSTVSFVTKRDGFIQYIDKVLAKKSTNSEKVQYAGKTQKGNNLQLHRTRRHIFNDKSDFCKGLQIASAITEGAAGIASNAATAADSIPFFGAPFSIVSSGIASGHLLAKMATDITYISMDCDSIPFDEIKEIMDERFSNLDEAVDRNYVILQEVSKMVSKTLTVVEQTRLEMHQSFNLVLESIQSSQIQPILSTLNDFIQYFDTEKAKINNFAKDVYISQIDDINEVLENLEESRIPTGNSFYTQINHIMQENMAIPNDADDILALSALYALHYATQTFVSILFFLIEQHSYLADHYFQIGDLENFNNHFAKIDSVFRNFRTTLAGSTNPNAVIANVIKIITEVQTIDFIADDKFISETLSEKLEQLEKSKNHILEMTLPIITDIPDKSIGTITFKPPHITTPIGDWKDEVLVSYAVQYKDGDKYSKVGQWSEPFKVAGEANPTFKVPVAENRRTRLIYRKFNELKPQLVGTIDQIYQEEYRDIDRDLYNAASWPSKNLAETVVDILLQNGANSTAIFDQGRRALHSAAYGGSPVIAAKLNPANINIRDDNGYTPLHVAAEAGNDAMVEMLAENGADLNAQTFTEELTPIHLAARNGYKSIVETLIKREGINMNLGDREGFTPLHSAVAGGLFVVEAILSHENADIKSNRGLSAFHLAAMNNYIDIANALLKHGNLSVNIEADGKMTPLHFATISGHLDMVKFLLDGGADINVKSATNWTPLHFAVSLNKVDIALELLKSSAIDLNPKNKDDTTPMHIACGTEQVVIVEKILENRTSDILQDIISTKNKDGLTPLHIAIMNKNSQIVSILLDKGAAIEERTNEGLTPILAAAANGNLDIVKILLSHKAQVSVTYGKDKNILHLAAENGHLDILKYLVQDMGLSVYDDSLLLSAISKGHLNILKYLVDDKRLDPTCEGQTYMFCPLSEASKYGNLDIFKYIESKYESVDLSENPLDNAVRNGHLHLVKYIMEVKGVVISKDVVDYLPMFLAMRHGWLAIVRYLNEKHRITIDIDRERYYNSNIQLAVSSGNLYLVKYILDSNPDNSAYEDPIIKRSLLHFAVRGPDNDSVNDKQSSSVLRYLVDVKHYNINAQDGYGRTPLLDAVRYESFYPVKFLILRGADMNIKDDNDNTLIDISEIHNKSDKIRQFLIMQNFCNDILKKKDAYIERGYNVNAECIDNSNKYRDDIYHTTALHLAVSAGAEKVVKLLLDREANVNARDEEGNIPLHFAVRNGNIELIQILLQSGADTTLKNRNNQTPKDLAKENHAIDIVEILMQAQLERNRGGLTRVKKSINQEASLGTGSSPKAPDNLLTYIIEKGCDASSATPLCLQQSARGNQDAIDVRGAQCLDSNVSLGLLLAQNFLNKKFPLPNFSHLSSAEVRAMALTISNKFEKLLKKHTKKADDLDFYQLYKDIAGSIKKEKFTNVTNILLKFAQNACGNDVDTVAGKIATIFS